MSDTQQADPISREGLLSLHEVRRLTTLSQSEVYRRMDTGAFPQPFRISPNRVAWRAGEVLDWIAALDRVERIIRSRAA